MENPVITEQQQKEEKRNIIFFWIMMVFFITVIGLYFYFFLERSRNKVVEIKRPDTDFYEIKESGEGQTEIVKIEEEPQETIITDLDFSQGDVSSFWMSSVLLKGYFHSYNPETNIIEVKNQFVQSKSLQLLEFNAERLNSFYCWPETIPSENGPVDIKTIELGISSPSANVYNPEEREVPFEQLDAFTTDKTFIFMQLDEAYDIEKTNYLRKLILVGC